jgi:hypothetical protein
MDSPLQVVEIDTVGTVSQGVVTYAVKLSFDTQDERVKSGMSVSASIVTDIKQDVLSVPASAVKSAGDVSYVEILSIPASEATQSPMGVMSDALPTQQVVEVGLSNDTVTEIVSGLKEGDTIVTRTIVAGTQTTPTAPSLFGGGGTRSTGGTRVTAP